MRHRGGWGAPVGVAELSDVQQSLGRRRGSGVTNGADVTLAGRTIDWFNKGLSFSTTAAGESQRLGGSEWFLRTTECRVLVEECEKRVLDPLQTAPINSPSPSSLSVSVEVPLSHALRLMRERNTGALALYAVEQEYTPDTDEVTEKPVYRGIVNILDILSYVIGALSDTNEDAPPIDPDALFEKQIGDVLGKTAESNATLFPGRDYSPHLHKGYLDSSTPLLDLCLALSSGQHWIFIRNIRISQSPLASSPSTSTTQTESTPSSRRGSLVQNIYPSDSTSPSENTVEMTMCSQADLVWFLQRHRKNFTNVFDCVVEEAMMQSLTENNSSVLDVDETAPTPVGDEAYARANCRIHDTSAPSGVISVPASCKTLKAFQTMLHHHLLAICIVDDEGLVCGELRATDLWGLVAQPGTPALAELRRGVGEFVGIVRGGGKGDGTGTVGTEYLSVERGKGLEEAMDKMMGSGVGRCWVVDGGRRPVGVVTFSDVVTMVLPDGNVGE
ncbi:hypothetical protein HK097_000286 [Rhizophlyctis rosea]|uniref:CBS domain-containing protein n=1 Tax=Rhizophlyctis rosea TaxID=64517 RepID=A0AAD5S8R6_9FUNG|nr:hypothetical protein HK097_000286 [Rhizophlyctis rosea]